MVTMIACFISYKGGVGKTTSCTNLAGFLKTLGKKILVVDCDAQANATSALGIDKSSIEKSIYEALNGNADIRETILENGEGIHIIPSNIELAGYDVSGIKELKTVLGTLLKIHSKRAYSYH